MRQFIDGTNEAFSRLETNARGACVRFRDQQLPPGCQPDSSDIGFEVDVDSGRAFVLVRRDVTYSGNSADLSDWFAVGRREFSDFASLVRWIKGPLAGAYQTQSTGGGQTLSRSPSTTAQPADLTDLPAVIDGVRNSRQPEFISEDLLFERVTRQVRGQDDAVRTLVSVTARHCARREPRRPAVLFAVGPSGVGKTKAAEALALAFSEADPEATTFSFLRLDMSEYQEAHRVSQLIGSPQGYLGHGDGSQLFDALHANPKTIILFDEIEKAHPAILRLLMNAMDAGRLSSASRIDGSHEIDCRFAVFVFTSNLDADAILKELTDSGGFGNRVVEDTVCRRKLRTAGIAPEIVGRIGRFMVFRPLTPEICAEIMVGTIVEVAAEYGLSVTYVAPTVVLEMMKRFKVDHFGMRPGQYMIDDALGASFASAAREAAGVSYRIEGPPFRCLPDTQKEDGELLTANHGNSGDGPANGALN
jgi:ATP-dependent Clp protease ATP-binding subunit ClpB